VESVKNEKLRRRRMPGTIVCGVGDSAEGRDAIQLAAALSRRLGQRLVLVHVRAKKRGRERLHYTLSDDLDLEQAIELREGVGESAQSLAQIAGEEGADLIVLWSRRSRLWGHRIECRLALELETLTTIPVVIAPPQTVRRSDSRLAVV
jgi:nucleotide-binding universal stress UspA family protein